MYLHAHLPPTPTHSYQTKGMIVFGLFRCDQLKTLERGQLYGVTWVGPHGVTHVLIRRRDWRKRDREARGCGARQCSGWVATNHEKPPQAIEGEGGRLQKTWRPRGFSRTPRESVLCSTTECVVSFPADRSLETGKIHPLPPAPFHLRFPGRDLGGKVSSHMNFPL